MTKETSERVKLNAEHVSKAMRESAACKYDHTAIWTQERRQAQSEHKKKFYSEHPEQHPNRKLAGNRGKMTYPEQLVNDWLIAHSIEFVHNYHYTTDKFNRYVDFCLVGQNIFIEVDGEHWHQDKTFDEAKDLDAQQHGIKTIRIKPKLNIIEQLEKELKF